MNILRPIIVTIHTAAIAHHLSVVRHQATHSKVWAIVKANAYGHGLVHAFAGLRDTDGFGLLDLEEAILLRYWGWTRPILSLGDFFSKRISILSNAIV